MFPHTDPQIRMELYLQRSDELIRQAAEYRRAHGEPGRQRRFGRWPRRLRPGGADEPVGP